MSFWNVLGVHLVSAADIGRLTKYFFPVWLCVDTVSTVFLRPPQGGGHLQCLGNTLWPRRFQIEISHA